MTSVIIALSPAAFAVTVILAQRWLVLRRQDRALGGRLHEAGRRRAARAAMDARHPLKDDHAGDRYLCWLEARLTADRSET